jgi:SAM-dependent methyltransferase
MFSDVPYVPSTVAFKKAIEYLDIKNGDEVLDMGSGDGRILLYASRKHPNANFVGIEKNYFLYIYSVIISKIFLRKNLKFQYGDFKKFDFSKFDAIYMYLLPKLTDEVLQKNIKDIKLGCRIISFHFPLKGEVSWDNNIVKYPVKYDGKSEYIYRFVKR